MLEFFLSAKEEAWRRAREAGRAPAADGDAEAAFKSSLQAEARKL